MSPGLPIDKHILSPLSLARGKVVAWPPGECMAALQAEGWAAAMGQEDLTQLLCFGCSEVQELLVAGSELAVSSMSTVTRQALCQVYSARPWQPGDTHPATPDPLPHLTPCHT